MKKKSGWRIAAFSSCLPMLFAGCYGMRASSGGAQTRPPEVRMVEPRDIALPEGYRIEAVARGLTYPTGVAFDENGAAHVVEAGYSYGEDFRTPRLLRVAEDGSTSVVAEGQRNGPWNGVDYRGGFFYVAEGGQTAGGRILRISPAGQITALVSGLPSLGDHHTNGPVMGPDGWLYFGQGTATNSGVVGEDNWQFGWLARHPDFHDIPGADVTLAGRNFESGDPREGGRGKVTTGAYSPFGAPTERGQVVRGQVPCNGAVMRVRPDGGPVELVAWGFRNPFGLAFSPDGRLYVTENGFDDRGSRPVWGTADFLWEVTPNAWYGWPDYVGGDPVNQKRYKPPRKPVPEKLLLSDPGKPPEPAAVLGVHASADGLDFSRSEAFGHVGDAFIALLGDMAPGTGKVLGPVGFKVVRVSPGDGVVADFAVNRGKENGPASRIGGGGLERPVAARFSPDGAALYVVDFGVLTADAQGNHPQPQTGVLWRIRREAQ